MDGPALKKRKANWSEKDLEILTDLVSANIDIIRAKFSPSLTMETKNKTWERIRDSLNASSDVLRTVIEVKKKWQDAQSLVKRKAGEHFKAKQKTGGGTPPPSLKKWEAAICETLPQAAISGLEGGVDTAETAHGNAALPVDVAEVDVGLPQISETVVVVEPVSHDLHAEAEDDVQYIPRQAQSAKKHKRSQSDNIQSFEEQLLALEKEKNVYRNEKLKLLQRQTQALEDIRDHLKGGAVFTW